MSGKRIKRKQTRLLNVYLWISSCFLLSSSPVFSEPLTLHQAIETALQSNLQMVKAEMDADYAQKQVQLEKRAWHPKWQVALHADTEQSKTLTHRDHGSTAGLTPSMVFHSVLGTEINLQATQNMTRGQTPQSHTLWQVTVEQPLLKGLSPKVNKASLISAKHQKKLTKKQQEETQDLVILTVIQHYVNLHTLRQTKQLQVQHLKNQESFQAVMSKKIEMGRMAELDGMMQALYLQRLQSSIQQTDRSLEKMKADLGTLIVVSLSQTEDISPLKSTFDELYPENHYLEKAKHYHLKAIEWDMDYLKQEKAILEDNQLWDLRLKGIFSVGRSHYRFDQDGLDFNPDLHNHARQRNYVGLFLNVPLSKDHRLELAKYQNLSWQHKRRLDYENKMMTLEMQVKNGYDQIAYWASQKNLALRAQMIAQKTLTIEEQKYLAGRSSALEWENAQASELQAAIDVLSTEMGLFLAHAELDYLCGLLHETWHAYV